MADFFPWDRTKYALEIDEMDRQHQILIAIMNKIAAKDGAGANHNEISGLLTQLVTYTQEHFSKEEAYMTSKKFPKVDMHRRIHIDLLRQLGEHVKAYDASTNPRLDRKVLDFLKFWLSAHILGIDKQYAAHVHAH